MSNTDTTERDLGTQVASITEQYGSTTEQKSTTASSMVQDVQRKYGSHDSRPRDMLVETSVEQKSAAAQSVPNSALQGRTENNVIDVDGLPEEYRGALEAEDFVIYGRASVEQYDEDDPKTLIEMDALEGALERFFESKSAPGIISMGPHKDMPVGVPLREYTLNEPAEITSDGRSYEFKAGDTLQTAVKDGDEDGRPELWLAANLDGESELGKRARLRALAGQFNGYSVTIHRNNAEWETKNKRRITDCDLMAVTLGNTEQIKNKGSEFGVAEYKSLLSGGESR